MKETNVPEFVADLDGGVLEQKIARALSDVAGGVIQTNKVGKVVIQFDLKQIGNSHQVSIKHKLAYVRPTAKGKASEEETTETPMHVGVGGRLTLFPEDQTQMFSKRGEVAAE